MGIVKLTILYPEVPNLDNIIESINSLDMQNSMNIDSIM